jgi:hypothetical protein
MSNIRLKNVMADRFQATLPGKCGERCVAVA